MECQARFLERTFRDSLMTDLYDVFGVLGRVEGPTGVKEGPSSHVVIPSTPPPPAAITKYVVVVVLSSSFLDKYWCDHYC